MKVCISALIILSVIVILFLLNGEGGWSVFSGETRGGAARVNARQLELLAREYKDDEGIFPPPDNKLFFECLGGKNKLQKHYLYLDQWPTDSQGRVLDRWGQPYWVEILGNNVKVHSATLDRNPTIY